jgi:RNA polymerase sigma-70 factor (ECF subfamily)
MKKSAKETQNREFEQEAMPHISLLHNYARRITKSSEDAEDLVQETYLKAYRFWGSYEKGTNIKAWLFRILRNTYINAYRHESRTPETVDFDNVHHLHHQDNPQPDTSSLMSVSNLLEDDVSKAVAGLPDEFRTVIILSDIEGLTYGEIAEFTASPIGTVRSRLHRGRKLLRSQLIDYARQKGLMK